MLVHERTCRMCHKSLVSVLDLGSLALSAFPCNLNDPLEEASLDLCRCPTCGLVQLRHSVEPDQLFKRYWYKSGVNETMRAELADVVADAVRHHGDLKPGDTVVDVGANDGTLLSAYPKDVFTVAYEPAENLQEVLRGQCDRLVPSYFPDAYVLWADSVSILTSIACFYAVDDPMAFVMAVDKALTKDGIWVVQFQDLHQMLGATAFDDICHEHVFYPSLAAISRMLTPFNLAIIDAERRAINGGSLRVTIGRRGRTMSPRVWELYGMEHGCEFPVTLRAFAERVETTRLTIQGVIRQERGIVDLYGASTKGNTLLQVCGLGPESIRQAWERSPEKWGRHTVTGIPIVSEDVGRADPPAMLFVGIWQFREAILQREEAYRGQFLFPLPKVEVVDVHARVRVGADAGSVH